LTFYAPVTDDTSICDVVGGVVPTVNGTGGDYLYANPSPHFYPSAQIIPFASAKGKVWVNDAPTKDGGEVLQGYPGTWTDTTLTLNQVIDQTGLSGQIYVGVETASGQIAWRAITISSGSYTIYNNYYRQLLAGNV
jgi:hypothetical protein